MHKKIGIIGGLSPESTISYYSLIIRSYFERFKNYNYPEIVIYSVSLQQYHDWRSMGAWDYILQDLVKAGTYLEKSNIDVGVIASNTMHIVFEEFQERVKTPFINIIDVTADKILQKGCAKVALLGTKFTMEEKFYHEKLARKGIECVVPGARERRIVHDIIVEELCSGKVEEESKRTYISIIQGMQNYGIDGVILGCTEIPLLIQQGDCPITVFDTTKIHADAVLSYAVSQYL